MNGTSTRDRILHFLLENPGAAKTDVCRGLDVGWGTTTHHLQQLERAGMVVARRHRGRAALFSTEIPERVQACLATLRDPGTRSLLDHLGASGDASLSDLAAQARLSRRVVSRHLTALQEVGLVEKRGLHRPLYRTARALKELG